MATLVSLAGVGLLLASSPTPGKQLAPCGLVASSDVARVQSTKVAGERESRKEVDGLSIAQCFYSAEPFTRSVSLEVTSAARGNTSDIRERWERLFHADSEHEGDREEDSHELQHDRSHRHGYVAPVGTASSRYPCAQ